MSAKPTWQRYSSGRRRWTAAQRRAIERLAARSPETALDEIAAAIGIKVLTLRRWLADADFRQAVNDRAREDIRACVPMAVRVLLKKALEDGDKECLKIILRIAGILDEETAPAPDVRQPLELLSDDELMERAASVPALLEQGVPWSNSIAAGG